MKLLLHCISSCLLLFTATSADETTGDYKMVLRPKDASLRRSVNSSIVLICRVMHSNEEKGGDDEQETDEESRKGEFNLKWLDPKDEELINTDPKNYRYVETSSTMVKLFINAVTLEDKGMYKCVGNIQGKMETKSIYLDVFQSITFNSAPSPQHPTIYTDATVVCVITGDPAPKISWKFKNSRIKFKSKSNKKYEILENNGLLVRNISKEDNGQYSCQAEVEQEGRFDERIITVDVYEPPKIKDGPGTNEWVDDDDVTMTCTADGYPKPEINFFKNGQKFETTDRITPNSLGGELKFSPLKLEDDGNYTCEASNEVGSDKAVGRIVVLMRPDIFSFKNYTVMEGQPLSIECMSHGIPEPNITITKVKGKDEDDDDEETSRMDTFKNGVGILRMTIEKSEPRDAGRYLCRSKNKVSEVHSSAYLTVAYKPKFLTKPDPVNIWVGKIRNVSCEVDAVPPSKVKWYNNGVAIENDNETYKLHRVSDGKSVLQVTVVQESDEGWIYGTLTCQADNEYGTSEINIPLKRATVPDAPVSVEMFESLPTGFKLAIQEPEEDGGEKVEGYQVEYLRIKGDDMIEVNIENMTSSPSYTPLNIAHVIRIDGDKWRVDGLQPNSEYILKVRAKTEVGMGNFKEIKAKTESTRQPYPIIIKPTNYSEAFGHVIEWEKPITGGFPITEYELRYRMKKDVEGGASHPDWTERHTIDNENKPMRSFHLDDLEDNTTYEVQVRAKNAIGWSDYCPSFEFRTKKASAMEYAARSSQANSSLLPIIIIVIILIILVIIIIIDISCYHLLGCGITSCILARVRGHSKSSEKVKVMEEGDGEKQPIGDDDDDCQKIVDNFTDEDDKHLKHIDDDDDDDIKKPTITFENADDDLKKESPIKEPTA